MHRLAMAFASVANESQRSQFDVLSFIDRGSFGEVWKVCCPETGNILVLKTIEIARAERNLRALGSSLSAGNEALVLKHIQCPDIVLTHCIQITEARIDIALEYMAGGTLLDDVLENGSLDAQTAQNDCRAILSGLQYLHGAGWAHRDLKLENILLSLGQRPSRVCKITDLGIAAQCGLYGSCSTVIGPLDYRAPEVWRSTKATPYGQQADVWSFGIVMYMITTSKHPFLEEDLYDQVLRGAYLWDDETKAAVPEACAEAIAMCLIVDPRRRACLAEVQGSRWMVHKIA